MRAVVELLAGARRLVIFTGAGVSAESGIPTFRDALGGLWARYDPAALATPAAFADDPALVWGLVRVAPPEGAGCPAESRAPGDCRSERTNRQHPAGHPERRRPA